MKTSATREKGKPIETIESKGVKIPLYDAGDGKVLISFYAEGKRKLVKCKSLEAAREEAKVKIQELTKGTAHVGTLTPTATCRRDRCNGDPPRRRDSALASCARIRRGIQDPRKATLGPESL